MLTDDRNRATRPDWLFALALIAAGTAISALSVGEIRASKPQQQLAQATHPSSPSEPQKKDAEPESTTGTARPTTPAPEPARPDAEAQKAGAQPALPPAPAEKIAPPIKER
jgi:cytoskeletal protein RodZ